MTRVLVDRLGLNLRNRAMHGLIEDVSAGDAALALHIALMLGAWQVGAAIPVTAGDDGDRNGTDGESADQSGHSPH